MSQTQEALIAVGVAAALADGSCDPQERTHLGSLAGALDAGFDATAAQLPADLAARLGSPVARQQAYELAVAVCHADGATNAAEQRFLDSLRALLQLDAGAVAADQRTAAALATAPAAGDPLGTGPTTSSDDVILQHALLAGALELLPQRLATMAVIPVQLRLVYLIGQRQGQTLDAAQAKDLLGTVGLGVATQVLDGIARKVLGGVARGGLGRLLGGLAGGAAGMAAGAGTVFAATYALGHAAEQYYAQGRQLSTTDLQALFNRLRDDATALYPRVQAQVEERARTLNLQDLLRSLTGETPPRPR